MRRRAPAAAVVASVVLLGLILCATAGNAVFVRVSVARLSGLAEALPAEPGEEAAARLTELEAAFARRATGLSLTVSFPLLDRVREQLSAARSYALSGSRAEYAAACVLLRDAIRDLARLERGLWERATSIASLPEGGGTALAVTEGACET